MKRLIFVSILFLTACAQAPTSVVPTEILDQSPTMMPTPTLSVITKPIQDGDKQEAFNFFYELKNEMALGEYEHFAESIRYPVTTNVEGQSKTFVYAAELEVNFEKIFGKDEIQKFISTDESELAFTPQGVKVADGIIWFDKICMDSNCEETEYLITQINN